MKRNLKIGTRASPLALWQAEYVKSLLHEIDPTVPIELITLQTEGDRDQATALSQMGGYGVFTKTIQTALKNCEIDLAVHSLKDLPTVPVEGLVLAATPLRGPTADVLISRKYHKFDELPQQARLGTSSIRRRAMVWHRRPDLQLFELRGNLATRMSKLDSMNLDAIILAEAGIQRLGWDEQISERLSTDWCLPAVGQGALGLECREDDGWMLHFLRGINHQPTWQTITAERSFLQALGGGCLVPIGINSVLVHQRLELRGAVLSPDGTRFLSARKAGAAQEPKALGQELAAELLVAGARDILCLA